MNVLISGARGLLGSALTAALGRQGDTWRALVRSEKGASHKDILWDPLAGTIGDDINNKFDAVVHLAGESIASGRWTEKKKKQIRASRIRGTTFLSQSLANLSDRPKVLLCASAIGIYGHRGSELLDENSAPGRGFLAELCEDWEKATQAASQAGIRVVNLRIGIALSPDGGALGKMLIPFQLGLGGIIGSGKQYMSWIAIDDVAGAMVHCLKTESLSGPVNIVAPEAATNLQFTKALGAVLKRPTIFPMPDFAASLVLGEMADELLLSSANVRPTKLLESGYQFQYTHLEEAFRHVLKK